MSNEVKFLITITPFEGASLQGEGSIDWQLHDLLMDQDNPNNVTGDIDGYAEEIKLVSTKEDE